MFILFCRMGKKKVEDSDSDTDDEEEKSSEDTKSVIIDEGNSSSSSDKSEENSNNNSSPVSGSPSNGELSGRESLETISEEENIVESGVSVEAEMESDMEMKSLANAEVANTEVAAETPCIEVNAEVANVEVAAETPSVEVTAEVANVEVAAEKHSVEVNAEVVSASGGICGLDEPLNFDNYNSPAELEVHLIVLISYCSILLS